MSLVRTNRVNGFDSEPCEVIDVTYAELVELMTGSALDLCAVYRITNFQTLHLIPGTADRNDTNTVIPTEVLLVRPSSTSTLFKGAQSESFPDDIIEYTTDNTAWKDLQIAGQKGCITLRIDPLRNIEVGNGDWENFIVRRYAVDLTAYSRGAIRWLLWGTSTNCGVTSAGATQTFTALDTNVYNAATNPDGYKDVKLFTRSSTTVNINIKRGLDNNTVFPMPNFYIEPNTQANVLKNVSITKCQNVSLTDAINDAECGNLENTICVDKTFDLNFNSGYIRNSFLSFVSILASKITNIYNCTIFSPTTTDRYYISLQGIQGSYIELTGSGFRAVPCELENVFGMKILITVGPTSFILRNISRLKYSQLGSSTGWKDITAFTSNVFFDSASSSNISISIAAAINISLSSASTSTVLDMFAGIINLTGSGTVNIDTLTRFLPNNFPITLVPESGLTIKIPTNNVANGFIQNETFVADGTLGEKLILTPVGDRWMVTAGNVVGSFIAAAYSATQLDKVANTTLADIPNLTANLKAGQAYAFKAKLFIDADAVGGYKFGLTGTAGINNLIWQVDAIDNGTNLFVINSRQTTFTNVGAVGATTLIVYIYGTIVVSTAGTLKLQFAQNVANGTSSVLVGSSFEVQQLN